LINIECPVHGKFQQKIFDHLQGSGCQKCQESKGERFLSKLFEKLEIKYIPQYRENSFIFDFYLPDYKMVIEYDGEQHFKPVDFAGKGIEWAEKNFEKIISQDLKKNKYCIDNGIIILRIPYYEDKEEVSRDFEEFFRTEK